MIDYKKSTVDKILACMETGHKYSMYIISTRSRITYPCITRIVPELAKEGILIHHAPKRGDRRTKGYYSKPLKRR